MSERVLIDIIGRDRFTAAADSAARSADRAATRMTTALGKVQKFGSTMTRHVTTPILGIAVASVYTAAKFDKSMTLLQTAGGETAAKVKVIGDKIGKVATDTGTSLGALGDGMYTVAKAGSQKWSAIDQLRVLKAAAQGAKAENVDLGTSTNALTSEMMSYHMSARQAVAAENMLIVGAGKAKTTMQEYAGAMSTVLPIASANKISFQEVAGAVATLTQHGTSAQEATQELANTIRNLAAPNQVAQKAMQQLHIGVVNVEKGLGRRGLSGTLTLIEDKLAKSSKAGMVVVNSFKQSRSASQDLNLMLAKMPKSLANVSAQFLHGSLGMSAYKKDIKSLGANGYAMGSQFLALTHNARGFNDLLKSGQPAQQTAAMQLKAMLGGATGLNTALQLGGENAGYYHRAIAEVGAAAKNAGQNVVGWSKTQGLLTTKWDMAKASLQVLGKDIGNDLIPAVQSLAHGLEAGVQWFDRLDPSMRHTIVTAALVAAALGPVALVAVKVAQGVQMIWTGSKMLVGAGASIMRFTSGLRMAEASVEAMGTKSYLSGMKVGQFFRNMGTGARLASTAIGSAGLGLAIGELTRNASGATQTIGLLGSVGAGAAMGFSMGGGPWGAALGGLMAGLGNLATTFFSEGDAAKRASAMARQAMIEQNQVAQTLLSTLESVKGAYNDEYKTQVINQLQSKGILNQASTMGLNLRKVIRAAMTGGSYFTDALNKSNISNDAYQKLLMEWNTVSGGAANAETGIEQVTRAQGRGLVSAKALAGGVANLNKELRGYGHNLTTQVKAIPGLQRGTGAPTEDNYNGNDLMAAQKQYQLNLQATSAFAKRNTEVIKENLDTMRKAALKTLSNGAALKDVTRGYKDDTRALEEHLVKAGFDRKAVEKLIAQYGKLPKSKITQVEAKTNGAKDAITAIKKDIADVKQGHVPGITADSAAGRAVLKQLQSQIDAVRQGKKPGVTADTLPGEYAIAALQKAIDALRQNHQPSLSADPSGVAAAVSRAQNYLDSLKGKTVYINTVSVKEAASGNSNNRGVGRASGGSVHGSGTKTSDSIAARLSDGEHVMTTDEVNAAGGHGAVYRMRAMIRQGLLKFAGGGAVGSVEKVGNGYRFNGQTYASKRAADNARNSALKSQASSAKSTAKSKIQGVIGGIGSAPTSQVNVASTGIALVDKQIAHARQLIRDEMRKGLIGKFAEKQMDRQVNALARQAQRQLGRLKVKIKHADLSAVKHAVTGTIAQARAAFATLIADARHAGYTPKAIAQIQAREKNVLADMRKRQKDLSNLAKLDAKLGNAPTKATAYDRLAQAQSNLSGAKDTVKSAILGGFDITTAGANSQIFNDRAAAPTTGKSILASLKSAVAKAQQFKTVLGKLAKMGLAKALIFQLASAGPDALAQAQALASSGAGTIKDITSQFTQLNQLADSTGSQEGQLMYGAGVASAQKLVNGLLSQRRKIKEAVADLVTEADRSAEKALENRRKHHHHHGGGHGHHGHHGHGHGHKRHGRAATHREAGVVIEHLEIHDQKDPVRTANAVTRRLAKLGHA